jgi:hypothetical protein
VTQLFLFLLFLVSPAQAAELSQGEKRLLTLDCPFLVDVYDPKDGARTQPAFCLYTRTETRGIFVQSACVGVLVETRSLTRNPFYGSKGHWGAEGRCDREQMLRKFKDKEIATTVNPVTSLRIKREEGMKLKLLRDEMKLWDSFEPLTQPKKK